MAEGEPGGVRQALRRGALNTARPAETHSGRLGRARTNGPACKDAGVDAIIYI